MPGRRDDKALLELGRTSKAALRWLAMVVLIAFILSAVACSDSQEKSAGATATPVSVRPTRVQEAPSPFATVTRAPTPSQPIVLADRTDCNAIRGTDYQSSSERAWFIANCSAPPAPAAIPANRSSPAPLANVQPAGPPTAQCNPPGVTSSANFQREYYDVAGTTLDQINASILAFGMTADDGTKAVGLTKYTIRRTGTRCARSDSCQVGSLRLEVTGTITLPRLLDPSALGPGALASWTSYVQGVSLHEDRHATIATEGTEEMKRQLLEIGTMPCAAFDLTLERIWRLQTEAIERRQAAFHVADRQGAGGLVVR